MTTQARHGVLAVIATSVIVTLCGRATHGAQKQAAPLEVTPVQGLSTLHHLHRTIEGSSMGWGGQWSAPLNLVTPPPRASARGDFVVSGADLYRISCRACHRPNGEGAPPEINSIIGPVQSASVQWLTERMKAMGRPTDLVFIRELTSSTEADLRKRFKTGGHDMPSFDHLSDDEINVLRPYLDQMAGLPGAEGRQRYTSEASARVGELIVKGTCHICHDATGPENVPTARNSLIPPLSSMSHQKTFADFVRKVREGAPIAMGSAGMSSRGRMPAFNYLTAREAAAAYSYLSLYPPKERGEHK
jgi:mono/diheme cytochrome c family protein